MHDNLNLPAILGLLAAAVVIVALFRRLRISPVLGYLVAGALVGPSGIGLISDVEGMTQIAEFGVVFLLFTIGLELSWERLRAIRKRFFAAGITQVIISVSVMAGGFYACGFGLEPSIIIGGALTLSSTALVLQLIEEHNQKASRLGRLSLAVLLIQDLAAIPLLVLVPAMAGNKGNIAMELGVVGLKATAALLFIFFAGRIVLRRVYRVIASLDNSEIFTALTLLIAVGTGWLTYQAGLSLALGAFIAGLLLAETEYRHQVEADVMPYKGLFLGLFFMAVGMSADLQLLAHKLPLIFGLAIGLMVVKAFFILLLCRLLGFGFILSSQAGLLLSQGGEFAFIVFGLASEHQFISEDVAHMLILVVTLSMALTPLAATLGRALAHYIEKGGRQKAEESGTEIIDIHDHVIIHGFGRVGQTIAKLLSAENIQYVALDMQASTVANAKKLGLPVYYGDGSRKEVLHAIGIERATAAIITVNDAVAAERAVRAIRADMPTLPIIARARDLKEVLSLENAGATIAVSEMFEASLQLGGSLLRALGIADHEISRITELFRDRDYALARGTFDVKMPGAHTPYNRMLAFQRSSVTSTAEKTPYTSKA